ncbi:MAG: hypothetical protein IJ011_07590 [Clostridia bacterium]|nr:hypothetical protein [Clostridia bacterium]
MEKKAKRTPKKRSFHVFSTVTSIVAPVIIAALLLCTVLVVPAAAWSIAAPALKYDAAIEHIENGEYDEAYKLFRDIRGYEDSEDYLQRFQVVSEKEEAHTYSSNGETTAEVTLHYISEINGYYYDFLKENTDCDSEYIYGENGKLLSSVHTFDDGRVYKRENLYGDGGELAESLFTMPDLRYAVSYGETGNIEKVTKTSSDGSIFEVEYDTHERVTGVTTVTPDGEATSYEDVYDKNGNVLVNVSTVRGKVFIDKYAYDGEGRRIKEETMNSDGTVTVRTYKYRADGKPLEDVTVNSDGSTRALKYFYDDSAMLIKFVSMTDEGTYTYEYTYNGSGKVTEQRITYSDGTTAVRKWVYDDNGNVIKKSYTDTEGRTSTDEYVYGDNGLLIKETHTDVLGNTRIDEYIYDDGRLMTVKHIGESGSVQTTEYTYDIGGEVIKTVGKNDGKIEYLEYRGHVLMEDTLRGGTYDEVYNVTAYYVYGFGGNVRLVIDVYNGRNYAVIYVYNNKRDAVLKLRVGLDVGFSAVITDYDEYGSEQKAVYLTVSPEKTNAMYKKWEYDDPRVTYTP